MILFSGPGILAVTGADLLAQEPGDGVGPGSLAVTTGREDS
jgi:hypothetical protein